MRASAGLSVSLGMAAMMISAMGARAQVAADQVVTVAVNAKAQTTPFPHFWEQTFGSGRAILALRQSYRDDIRTVKKAADFRAVRFHGIFNDEVGLYDPDRVTKDPGLAAQAVKDVGPYNFSYVDQIYDGLLDLGVKPFVEMSFTPKKLASDPAALHPFWYKPNVSPPKDYGEWDKMIEAFARHLIERYGIEEVASWRFEVWNEPNLDFWGGSPKMPTYFELYDHTATALKRVSERIHVGGPATAQAGYVGEFLAHCKEKNVRVDFTSTHVYANDTAKDVFKTDEQIPRDQMVYRAVKKVHEEIAASPYPKMPLIFSEYNASYSNEPDVTDSVYMGSWLANNIRLCDGLVDEMSYWSFSDVFEEQGVVRTPFYGGFGVIAADGIPKPALHAFAMLHQLGDRRIQLASESALATKSSDGAVEVALWNYAAPYGTGASYTPPPKEAGPRKNFLLKVDGVRPDAAVELWRLDEDHGNVVKAFDAMGRPATPSREQIAKLRAAGAAAPVEKSSLNNGSLSVEIPPQGLVVVKVQPAR